MLDFTQPIEFVHVGNNTYTARNTAKPSTPSNEELTQRMEIPQRMAQRMAQAWKRLAQVDPNDIGPHFASNCVKTAQAIVSDLPKSVDPIDPDLIEAREICASRDGVDAGQANAFRNGSFDVGSNVPLVLAGIKLGRTLAAGGTAHE